MVMRTATLPLSYMTGSIDDMLKRRRARRFKMSPSISGLTSRIRIPAGWSLGGSRTPPSIYSSLSGPHRTGITSLGATPITPLGTTPVSTYGPHGTTPKKSKKRNWILPLALVAALGAGGLAYKYWPSGGKPAATAPATPGQPGAPSPSAPGTPGTPGPSGPTTPGGPTYPGTPGPSAPGTPGTPSGPTIPGLPAPRPGYRWEAKDYVSVRGDTYWGVVRKHTGLPNSQGNAIYKQIMQMLDTNPHLLRGDNRMVLPYAEYLQRTQAGQKLDLVKQIPNYQNPRYSVINAPDKIPDGPLKVGEHIKFYVEVPVTQAPAAPSAPAPSSTVTSNLENTVTGTEVMVANRAPDVGSIAASYNSEQSNVSAVSTESRYEQGQSKAKRPEAVRASRYSNKDLEAALMRANSYRNGSEASARSETIEADNNPGKVVSFQDRKNAMYGRQPAMQHLEAALMKANSYAVQHQRAA